MHNSELRLHPSSAFDCPCFVTHRVQNTCLINSCMYVCTFQYMFYQFRYLYTYKTSLWLIRRIGGGCFLAFAWSIVLSIVQPIVLPTYLLVYLSFHRSIYRSICRSIYRFIYRFIDLSIVLSIYLSLYLSFCLSIGRSIYFS